MLTLGVKTVAQTPVLINAERIQLKSLLSLHYNFDKDIAGLVVSTFRFIALDPASAKCNVVL